VAVSCDEEHAIIPLLNRGADPYLLKMPYLKKLLDIPELQEKKAEIISGLFTKERLEKLIPDERSANIAKGIFNSWAVSPLIKSAAKPILAQALQKVGVQMDNPENSIDLSM
jgi:hypothetical protein